MAVPGNGVVISGLLRHDPRISGNHLIALIFALVFFVGGVVTTIAASVVFRGSGTPVTSSFTPTMDAWVFGYSPGYLPPNISSVLVDDPVEDAATFSASLIAIAIGAGFGVSSFRVILFREPEIRRLDFIITLLQLHNLLYYTLRACMLLPTRSGFIGTVRDACTSVMLIALYLSTPPRNHRPALLCACVGVFFIAVGLIDRAIQVGAYSQYFFDGYSTKDPGTWRHLVYYGIFSLCQLITSWFCAFDSPGNDYWSRWATLTVALAQPVALQILRITVAPGKTAELPTFRLYVYTAIAYVFTCTIQPHAFVFMRARCLDTLNMLKRRVEDLDREAAISSAVSTAQREFTRFIFHEVRSPLNNLSLSIDLLACSPVAQNNPEVNELIKLMGQSTTTVRGITDDILLIGKLDSGEFSLFFAPLVINDIVDASVNQLVNLARTRQARISYDIEAGIPHDLLGAAPRIRQVLTNLIGNAVKFVPEHTGQVNIRAFVKSTESHLISALPCPSSRTSVESFTANLAKGSFTRSMSGDVVAQSHAPSAPPQPHATARPPSVIERVRTFVASVFREASSAQPRDHSDPSQISDPSSDEIAPASSVDPRLPFANAGGCFHAVDVPSSVFATNTIVIVRFEVKDNGIGLTLEQKGRLFKPYSQVQHRREFGGTGLGLYISLKLAEQMGGRIGVESEGEGRGAMFWFEVPLRVLQPLPVDLGSDAAQQSPNPLLGASTPVVDGTGSSSRTIVLSSPTQQQDLSPPVKTTSHQTIHITERLCQIGSSQRFENVTKIEEAPAELRRFPTAASSNHSITPPSGSVSVSLDAGSFPLHVLLVDDVDSIRMLMRRLITKHFPAAIIQEAPDGKYAIEIMAAAKDQFSPLFSEGVICMDKEMPRCDGFEATRHIRAMGFRGLLLGVTGNAIADDVTAFLGHGANAVIPKPVSFPVLLRHIKEFMDRNDMKRETSSGTQFSESVALIP